MNICIFLISILLLCSDTISAHYRPSNILDPLCSNDCRQLDQNGCRTFILKTIAPTTAKETETASKATTAGEVSEAPVPESTSEATPGQSGGGIDPGIETLDPNSGSVPEQNPDRIIIERLRAANDKLNRIRRAAAKEDISSIEDDDNDSDFDFLLPEDINELFLKESESSVSSEERDTTDVPIPENIYALLLKEFESSVSSEEIRDTTDVPFPKIYEAMLKEIEQRLLLLNKEAESFRPITADFKPKGSSSFDFEMFDEKMFEEILKENSNDSGSRKKRWAFYGRTSFGTGSIFGRSRSVTKNQCETWTNAFDTCAAAANILTSAIELSDGRDPCSCFREDVDNSGSPATSSRSFGVSFSISDFLRQFFDRFRNKRSSRGRYYPRRPFNLNDPDKLDQFFIEENLDSQEEASFRNCMLQESGFISPENTVNTVRIQDLAETHITDTGFKDDITAKLESCSMPASYNIYDYVACVAEICLI